MELFPWDHFQSVHCRVFHCRHIPLFCNLTLCPATTPNLLLLSVCVCVWIPSDFLCKRSHGLWIDSLASSVPIRVTFTQVCCPALPVGPAGRSWTCGQSRRPSLAPDLRAGAPSLPAEREAPRRLSQMPFVVWDVPFCFQVAQCFYPERMLDFVKCFFCDYCHDMGLLIFILSMPNISNCHFLNMK